VASALGLLAAAAMTGASACDRGGDGAAPPSESARAPEPPAPTAPAFVGFDPAAVAKQLQGIWLAEGGIDVDIVEIAGNRMSRVWHDEILTAAMTVDSPCSLHSREDDDGLDGWHQFALLPDGPIFGDLAGTRAAGRTVVCFVGRVFVDDGHGCTAWDDVGGSAWREDYQPCRMETFADGVVVRVGEGVPLTLHAAGTALYGLDELHHTRRFATLDDARRAAAVQDAATRTQFEHANTVKALVAAVEATRHATDRELKVKVRGYARFVVPDQHHIDVADTKVRYEHELYVECDYEGEPPRIAPGDLVTVSGVLYGESAIVGHSELSEVALHQCALAAAK
jgi:hypothetical protein